jgi:hypothetical protein
MPFSKKKVLDSLNAIESLSDSKDISFSLCIAKEHNSDELVANLQVNITMESEESVKYIEAIHECHDKIQYLGYQNIMLTSGNTEDGKSHAFIYANIIL